MAELAMGARADPEKVPEAPVIQVMPCFASRLGVGRHFVLAIAVFPKQRLTGLLNIPKDVIFRQRGRLIPEHRIR
ncbi:hypothetical protein AO263_16920, partial [Pseudomonas sp. NZIPFR-PS5]